MRPSIRDSCTQVETPKRLAKNFPELSSPNLSILDPFIRLVVLSSACIVPERLMFMSGCSQHIVCHRARTRKSHVRCLADVLPLAFAGAQSHSKEDRMDGVAEAVRISETSVHEFSGVGPGATRAERDKVTACCHQRAEEDLRPSVSAVPDVCQYTQEALQQEVEAPNALNETCK